MLLVLGTNTYATVEDSSGTFSIPVLAEGDYELVIHFEDGFEDGGTDAWWQVVP